MIIRLLCEYFEIAGLCNRTGYSHLRGLDSHFYASSMLNLVLGCAFAMLISLLFRALSRKSLCVFVATTLCLILSNCAALRHASNPLAESVDIAPESLRIETGLTVQGSIVRFTMKNREKSLWLVSENVLNVGEDGFFNGELFSWIAGQFRGRTSPPYRQPFLLNPGQTYTSQVDLRKNYTHLDMAATRFPKSLSAGIALFSTPEAANNFLLFVRSQPTFDPSIGMLPSQFKAHIVCPFRNAPH